MAKYKCVRCGKELDSFPSEVIRCTNCSFRVMEKVRPQVTKEILAR
jgi:DNA-directed RNA polymerase subunit RPC12/RpoP